MNGSCSAVLVVSKPFSGSTVLDLLLGAHPDFVGIGEAYHMLNSFDSWRDRLDVVTCSCGSSISGCPFWGTVTKELIDHPPENTEAAYRMLHRVFSAQFPDRTPVDTSKTVAALDAWRGVPGVSTRVLFLVRDVRGWTFSWRKNHGKGRTGRCAPTWITNVHRLQRVSPTACFLAWYFSNRRKERALDSRNAARRTVGYDALCLDPEAELRRLCAFLEVPFVPEMMDLGRTDSHNILGNRMRLQRTKRSRLIYDSRWLRDRSWLSAAILLPWIMRYNERMVYGPADGPASSLSQSDQSDVACS